MNNVKTSILEIKNLSYERNDNLILRQLDFVLNAGEALQVRGSNGSGKSTLLRILAGYIQPEMGKVLWRNQCIFAECDAYQQQLHYLGHQNGIKPNLSVLENLQRQAALNATYYSTETIKKILNQVDLHPFASKLAMHLSAGQQRRLGLARLLLTDKKLWILDEPATALDNDGVGILITLITDHLKNKGLVIFATHQNLPFTVAIPTLQLEEHHYV